MNFKAYLKQCIRQFRWNFKCHFRIPYCPNVSENARIGLNTIIGNPNNIFIEGNSTLKRDSVIMNGRAKFIMKKNSGAAEELMVIAGNHLSVVGLSMKQVSDDVKDKMDDLSEYDKDIVINEDVWIGARVTILAGVQIGRGCEIGAGAVVRSSTPPYSIVIGNPAKIVGFRFTPEETLEHEKVLYSEEDRLPIEFLNKNYEKFYLKRIKEIREWTRI